MLEEGEEEEKKEGESSPKLVNQIFLSAEVTPQNDSPKKTEKSKSNLQMKEMVTNAKKLNILKIMEQGDESRSQSSSSGDSSESGSESSQSSEDSNSGSSSDSDSSSSS